IASTPIAPAAATADTGSIDSPANDTETPSCSTYAGACGTGKPSGRAGDVVPQPVAYSVIVSPGCAGAAALTGDPSACTATANDCPFTTCWNRPGASCDTVALACTSGCPCEETVSTAFPSGISVG